MKRKLKQFTLILGLSFLFVMFNSGSVLAAGTPIAEVTIGEEETPENYETFEQLQAYLNQTDFQNQSVVVEIAEGVEPYELLVINNHTYEQLVIKSKANQEPVIQEIQISAENADIDISGISTETIRLVSANSYQKQSFTYLKDVQTLNVEVKDNTNTFLTTLKLNPSTTKIISALDPADTEVMLTSDTTTITNDGADMLIKDAINYQFKAVGNVVVNGDAQNNNIKITFDNDLAVENLSSFSIDGKAGEDSVTVESNLILPQTSLRFDVEKFKMEGLVEKFKMEAQAITITSASEFNTEVNIKNVDIISDTFDVSVKTENNSGVSDLITQASIQMDQVNATINQDINLKVYSGIVSDNQSNGNVYTFNSEAKLLLTNGSVFTSVHKNVNLMSDSTIIFKSQQSNEQQDNYIMNIAKIISGSTTMVGDDVLLQGNQITVESQNIVDIIMGTVYAVDEADLYLVALELQQTNDVKVNETATIKGKNFKANANTQTGVDLKSAAGSIGKNQNNPKLSDVFEKMKDHISNNSLELLKKQLMSVIYNIGFLDYADANKTLEEFLATKTLADLKQAVGSMSLATINTKNQTVVDGIIEIEESLMITANTSGKIKIVADGTGVVVNDNNKDYEDYTLGLASAIHALNLVNKATFNGKLQAGKQVEIKSTVGSINSGDKMVEVNALAGYNKGEIGHTASLVVNSMSIKNEAVYSGETTTSLESLIIKAESNKELLIEADSSFNNAGLYGGATIINTIVDENQAFVTEQAIFGSGVSLGQLNIISDLSQIVNINATSGSGADAKAVPVYVANTIITDSLAKLAANQQLLNVGNLDIYTNSEKRRNIVLKNMMSSDYHAKGMNVLLSVVNDRVQALLNRAVTATGSVKVRTRSAHTQINSVTNESSDSEDGESDPQAELETVSPDTVLENFKDLSQGMLKGVLEDVDFEGIPFLEDFNYSFASPEEDESQTAGNIIANIIISDTQSQINADINASVVEVITNSGFSINNLADSVTVGSNDKATAGSLILVVAVIDAKAVVNANITANQLSIQSTTAETEKYLKDHKGINNENYFYNVSISGGAGSEKSTTGALSVMVITQNYQAIMNGNATLTAGNGYQGNLFIKSEVTQKIYAEALATHGIPFSFDFLLEQLYENVVESGGSENGDEEATKGLGASIAVLVLISDVSAIYNGATLTAHDVEIDAKYTSDIYTAAEAGAELNVITADKAFDGGVAVNVILADVKAQLGGNSPVAVTITGDLSITTNVTSDVYADSFANSLSGENSKGISVAFNFLNGDVLSILNATGTLAGNLKVISIANNTDLVNADAAAWINPLSDIMNQYGLSEDIGEQNIEEGNFQNNNYDPDKPNALVTLILKYIGDTADDYVYGGKSLSMTLLDLLEVYTVVPDGLDDVEGENSNQEDKKKEKRVGLAATVAVNVLLHDVQAIAKGGLEVLGNINVEAKQSNNNHVSAGAISFSTGNSIALSVGLLVNSVNTEAVLGKIKGKTIKVIGHYGQNIDEEYLKKATVTAASLALALKYSSENKEQSGNGQNGQGEEKSYAIAGAIALIISKANTSARIEADAEITAEALIILAIEQVKLGAQALDGSLHVDISGGKGGKAGGASVAMIYADNSVKAAIGNNAKLNINSLILKAERLLASDVYEFDVQVTEDGSYQHNLPDDFYDQLNYNNYYVEAIGAALAPKGSFSGTGSITLLILNEKTKASIGNNVIINSQGDVIVEAISNSSAASILGAIAMSESKGIGGTVGFVYNRNITEASIGENTQIVINNGKLSVTSTDYRDLLVFAVAAAASYASSQESTGLGFEGVVIVFVSINNVSATIGESSFIQTTGNIDVKAINKMTLKAFGNGLSLAKGNSVGITTIVAVIKNKTEAMIADGVNIKANELNVEANGEETLFIEGVNAAGSMKNLAIVLGAVVVYVRSEVQAIIGGSNNDSIIEVNKLTVNANSVTDSTVIAGLASVSGTNAFGVVNNTNVYRKNIKAHINKASIKAHQVYVSVNGEEKLVSLVMGISGAKTAAIDAAVAVINIMNEMEATIDGIIEATGMVSVKTLSTQTLKSYVGAIAGSGSFSVGASVIQLYTASKNKALLQGNIKAGAVDVIADSKFDFKNVVFAGVASGKFAGSGAVSVVIIADKTQAMIADNSQILAKGDINVTADSNTEIDATVGQLSGSATLAIGASTDTINLKRENLAIIGKDVKINENQSEYGSINVNAISNIIIKDIIAGVAGSQVSVMGMSLVIIINEKTQAYLDDNVLVKAKDINIDASLTSDIKAYLGRLGIGGIAGVGASSFVMNFQADILAKISNNNNIQASGNLSLNSKTNHTFLTGLASISGGNVTATGSSIVIVQEDKVQSNVGIETEITAQSVSVNATADLSLTTFVGMVELAGGMGAGIGSLVINSSKNTSIEIGLDSKIEANQDIVLYAYSNTTVSGYVLGAGVSHSVAIAGQSYIFISKDVVRVNADASSHITSHQGNVTLKAEHINNSDVKLGVVTGTINAGAALAGANATFNFTSQVTVSGGKISAEKTVTLLSNSTTTLDVTGVSGSIGLSSVTLAATVVTVILNGTIAATIKGNVDAQSVNVTAEDNVKIKSRADGLSGSLASAVGAGVSILLIRQTIMANVENAVTVKATEAINILASSSRNLDLRIVGLGLGQFNGLSGSIVVIDIGSTSELFKNKETGNNQFSTKDYLEKVNQSNAQAMESHRPNNLNENEFNGEGQQSVVAINQKLNKITKGDTISISDQINNAYKDTITASVGSNTVLEANVVDIKASDSLVVLVDAGNYSGSMASAVGVSVVHITLNSNVVAAVNSNAIIRAKNRISIVAEAVKQDLTVNSVAGQVAMGPALNASYLEVNYNVNTKALIGAATLQQLDQQADNSLIIEVLGNVNLTTKFKVGSGIIAAIQAGATVLIFKFNGNISSEVIGSNITGFETLKVATNWNQNTTINVYNGKVSGLSIGGLYLDYQKELIQNTRLGGTIEGNDVLVLALVTDVLSAEITSGTVGIADVSASDINFTDNSEVTTSVAQNAVLNVRNIDVISDYKQDFNINVKGDSYTGITIGATEIEVTLNATINTEIGNNVNMTVSDSFRILSLYNSGIDQENNYIVPQINGRPYQITVNASSASSNLVNGSGVKVYINQKTGITTRVGHNGTITAGDQVWIGGSSDFNTNISIGQNNNSVAGIGFAIAEYQFKTAILTEILSNTSIKAQQVRVETLATSSFTGDVNQMSGGFISIGQINSNELTVTSVASIQTIIHDFVSIEAQQDIVISTIVSDTYDLLTNKSESGFSGITVAGMKITVNNSTKVITELKNNTNITGYNITIAAKSGSSYTVNNHATLAEGGSFVGSVGADTKIELMVSNLLKIGNDNTLTAKEDITLDVLRSTSVESVVKGSNGLSLVSKGYVSFFIEHSEDTQLMIGNDNKFISKTINIHAFAAVYLKSEVTGGSTSIAGTHYGIKSEVISKPDIRINFGNDNTLDAEGKVSIKILGNVNIDNKVETDQGALIHVDSTSEAINTLELTMNINLGQRIEIIGQIIEIEIMIDELVINTAATAFSKSADQTVSAYANILNSKSEMNISSVDAKLKASDTLRIMTSVNNYRIETRAFGIIGGVTGVIYSESKVIFSHTSSVQLLGHGSTYEAINIIILVDTPIDIEILGDSDGTRKQEVHAQADTVVEWVTEKVTQTVKVLKEVTEKIVEWLPWPFDKLVKFVTRTFWAIVEKTFDILVQKVLHSDAETNNYSDVTSETALQIQGTISYGAANDISVIIDANGNISVSEGTVAYLKDGKIYIDKFGLPFGKLILSSRSGDVLGDVTIIRNNHIKGVEIINHSQYDLVITGLDLTDYTVEFPEYELTGMNVKEGQAEGFNVKYLVIGNQTEYRIQSTNEGTNVTFTGSIRLSALHMIIDVAGDVFLDAQSSIHLAYLEIKHVNQFGSKDTPINIVFMLYDDKGDQPHLSVIDAAVVNISAYLYYFAQDETSAETMALKDFVIDTILANEFKLVINKAFVHYVMYVENNEDPEIKDVVPGIIDDISGLEYRFESQYQLKLNDRISIDQGFMLDAATSKDIVFNNQARIQAETVTLIFGESMILNNLDTPDITAKKVTLTAKGSNQANTIGNSLRNLVVSADIIRVENVSSLYLETTRDQVVADFVAVKAAEIITKGIQANFSATNTLKIVSSAKNVILTGIINTVFIQAIADISINVTSDLTIDQISTNGSNGNVSITAQSMTNKDREYNIQAYNLTLVSKKHVGNMLKVIVGGELNITAVERIELDVVSGNIIINAITTQGDVKLLVADNIFVKGNGNHITANNLSIEIGDAFKNVLQVALTGTLQVQAVGNVMVTENHGDLNLILIDTEGDVILRVTSGSLVAQADKPVHVVANDLNITVNNHVGTPLKVVLQGVLTVVAKGKVAIHETIGDMKLAHIHTVDSVQLQAAGSLIALAETTNISGKDLQIIVAGAVGPVVNVTLTGTLKVKAQGDVTIASASEDLRVLQIQTAGNVSLTTVGDVIVTTDQLHIEANRLEIIAGGSIGTLAALLQVKLQGSMKLQAVEDIGIEEVNGNIIFESISTSGNVKIVAAGGIAGQNSASLISGNRLTLQAQSIGSETNPLRLDMASEVYMQAVGDICFESLSDLIIATISTEGNVVMTVNGDVFGQTGSQKPHVMGQNLVMNVDGNIGLEATYLRILIQGSLQAFADEKIYIDQIQGNLLVDQLVASHTIGLKVKGGLLVIPQTVNIAVDTLRLETGLSIATAAEPLKLSVNNIHAVVITGDIYLYNNKDLNIDGAIMASDAIVLNIQGNLTGSDNHYLKAETADITVANNVGTTEHAINLDVSTLRMSAKDEIYLAQNEATDLHVEALNSNYLIDLTAGNITGFMATENLRLTANNVDIVTNVDTVESYAVGSYQQYNQKALSIKHIAATHIVLDVKGDIIGFEDNDHISKAQSLRLIVQGNIGSDSQLLRLNLAENNQMQMEAGADIYLQMNMVNAGIDYLRAKDIIEIQAVGSLLVQGIGSLSSNNRIDIVALGHVGRFDQRLIMQTGVVKIQAGNEVGIESLEMLYVEAISAGEKVFINAGNGLHIVWIEALGLDANVFGDAMIEGLISTLRLTASTATVINNQSLSIADITVGNNFLLQNNGNVTGGLITTQDFNFNVTGNIDVTSNLRFISGQATGSINLNNEGTLAIGPAGITANGAISIIATGNINVDYALSTGQSLVLTAGNDLNINGIITVGSTGTLTGSSIYLMNSAQYNSSKTLNIVVAPQGTLRVLGTISAAQTIIKGGADNEIYITESMGLVQVDAAGTGNYYIKVGSLHSTLTFNGTAANESIQLDLSSMQNTKPLAFVFNGIGGEDVLEINLGQSNGQVQFEIDNIATLSLVGTDQKEMLEINSSGLSYSAANAQMNFVVNNTKQFNYSAQRGDKHIIFTDTFTKTNIQTGSGKDIIQIGTFDQTENGVLTPSGILSAGVSHDTQINAGSDNDVFIIYSNKAPLSLSGGDGDDQFYIRAFIDKDSKQIYNMNAAITIDGGQGTNTLHIINAYLLDRFISNEQVISGSGYELSYTNITSVEQHDRHYSDDNIVAIEHNMGFFEGIYYLFMQIVQNYVWALWLTLAMLITVAAVIIKKVKSKKVLVKTDV